MIEIKVKEPYDEFCVNKALSKLKKIMSKDGTLKEIRDRRCFKTKNEKIREKKRKNWRKK